jgi:hypothetical protein
MMMMMMKMMMELWCFGHSMAKISMGKPPYGYKPGFQETLAAYFV